MNYRDKYNALPAAAQKAIRELMDALLKCDREPIISTGGTICQSRFETAVMQVDVCTCEIKERYTKQ